jgi:DNA modification methylase
MGGGTTVAVAERLGRRFIGIDESEQAFKVTEQRLRKQNANFTTTITKSAKTGIANSKRSAKCDKMSTVKTI